jgi:hypothetical protein
MRVVARSALLVLALASGCGSPPPPSDGGGCNCSTNCHCGHCDGAAGASVCSCKPGSPQTSGETASDSAKGKK